MSLKKVFNFLFVEAIEILIYLKKDVFRRVYFVVMIC